MCPDGVALPSRQLLFPDPCLNMKSNYLSNNGIWTVFPRRLDGSTWTLDSSWTLNSVRAICQYVRTDAIMNSSKFIDTDGRPDGKFSSSGWMLLTEERLDGNTTSSGRLLGIRLLWVGIYTESSLNTEIAFMKLVTLATCHNTAISTSEK
jgi:hypothetical protein